jgi:dipeptidyl aminopeptidase/acylaminoacyl peptidase
MRPTCVLAVLTIVSGLASIVGRADHRRFVPKFTLEQITQVRTLGQFAISPMGTHAACTLAGYYYTFPVIPRFGSENNLRVIDLHTGEARQLTSGPMAKTNPVFSPSGDRLAFESEDDLWVVAMSDGSVTRVTTNAARDRDASWSPDGRHLAFVSQRGRWPDIYVADVTGERHGLRQITRDELTKSDPQWSPDGSTILFTGKRSEEYYSQGVYAVPAEGGPSRRVTPDDGFDHSTGRWSPDGRRIALLSDRSGYTRVWTMDASGGNSREYDTGRYDATSPHWTVQPVWSRDGRDILVSVNKEGRYELVTISTSDGRVEIVGSGRGQHHEVGWRDDGALVYAYENAWSPPDLFIRPRLGAARQVTFSSHVAFREEHFATVRRVSFASSDGLEIPGFLLTPSSLAASERVPAIVNLHPNGYGQFYDQWSPFLHYMAQSGYAMLLVDQRGSAGYGRAFREAQIGAWGTKTARDVEAAAAFIRSQSFVNPKRVGVMGLSFGGYQALLALTKTPDLFQAGVDMMGPTDRRGGYTDRYRALQIGATEAEDPERYNRISPITSVKDLRAPLLILHSDRDRNVAPEFTYRLIDELELHHKYYEVRIYADEAHGLADPHNQRDSYERILRFFDRHLASRDPMSKARSEPR